MKEQKYRITYFIICLVIAISGYYFCELVTSDNNTFNKISYIGTIITAIAFIIAAFEVIHSIHVSKSINEQAKILLTEAITINKTSSISDCLSIIDDLNRHVMNENYQASVSSFQQLRKLFVKLDVYLMNSGSKLNSIEKLLHKATKTTPNSPLGKRQKDGLIDEILSIKVLLEESNPANGRT